MDNRIERIRQSFFPRTIEENDTDDSITRHEPDYQKRKQRPHDDWQDHEEDMANISVESLIVFLEGLIGETRTEINDDSVSDTKMAKAAQAYASHSSQKISTHHHDHGGSDSYGGAIIDLIQKLESLHEGGCSHVDLIQGDGFLDSIEKTVEKYHAL
jgi:hypothetical protein